MHTPRPIVVIPLKAIASAALLMGLVFIGTGPAHAGPIDEASTAYEKKDYATALALWRPLAEQGNAEAERGLGILYENGFAVPKDEVQVLRWFTKAADQGDAEAEYRLGEIYIQGADGVTRDSEKGFAFMKKAVDQGHGGSAREIGEYYRNGLFGFPKDAVQAAVWHKKGAELGDTSAEDRLGTDYEFGLGVPKDIDQAKFWYKKAMEQTLKEAEQGKQSAQANAAFNYEMGGMGYGRNLQAALSWYQKAAQQDDYRLKAIAEVGIQRVKDEISREAGKYSNFAEQPIIVTIDALDHVYIEQQQVALESLGPKLKTLRNPDSNPQIFLRGDKKASYNQIMQVMSAVKAAGFTKIALVANQPSAIGTEQPKLPRPPENTFLTIADVDTFNRQIEKCWNVPVGGPAAQNIVIELSIDYNPDHTVANVDIVDKGRYASDPFFHSIADSAVRAVQNQKCRPLELPADKYDQWKHITLRLKVRDIL